MAKTASKNHPIQVERSEAGPCLHRITVTVPAARVRQEFDHTYKAASRQVKLPGFRPGKVPVEVLRKRFGDSLVEDAREHLFEHVINEAVHQEGLHLLRILDFKPEDHQVSEEADLRFEFQVECAPEIDLPPWEEIKIVAEATEPEEAQIDSAFEALGRDHPRFDEAADQDLDDEHLAESDLAYFKDGAEGPKAEALRLTVGAPLYGADPEAYAEAMRGVKAGAEIRLPVEFNEGFSEADWIGSKGEAVIKVKRIVKPRPGTPEEIAKDVGLEDEAQLRERVVDSLRAENESRERSRQAFEVLEAIARQRPFDLPPRLLEEETEEALKSHTERLQKEGGLSAEEAAAQGGQAREQIEPESERRLRHYFLVRKVAEAEGIRVTSGDLDRAFRGLAARHQTDPKAIRAYYDEKGLTGSLQREILEGKVRQRLVEKAEIAPAPPAE